MNLNNLTLKGTELATTRKEVEQRAKPVKKLTDHYTEFSKLVFIFDVSGSMIHPIIWKDNAPSKINLVKKLARQEIEARFAKFPDSRVACVLFGKSSEVLFDDAAPDAVWTALDFLNVGGTGKILGMANETDIMSGIRSGLETCRKHPSPVGVHHLIIVSDGGDAGTYVMPEWVSPLKASGVVLDYIHIGTEGSMNDPLRDACKELGGEAVLVDSDEAFESRFIAAAQRLMLPPGGAQ